MRARQEGFTLIELLIVVAIIGIIAAIASASLLNAIERSRQSRTMADMRSVATALQEYSIDNSQYPDVNGTVTLLGPSLSGTYMRNLPLLDAWQRDLIYAKLDLAVDGAEYILWSLGKDGIDDGNNGDDGATSNFNADIVIFDGRFTQYPAGRQE